MSFQQAALKVNVGAKYSLGPGRGGIQRALKHYYTLFSLQRAAENCLLSFPVVKEDQLKELRASHLADPVPLGPLHQPCFVLGFF
jgi:hypothetical protein